MSQYITTLNDDNFETEVNQSTLPVLVDFWAEWCGPCKMLSPILEEIAIAYQGKVKVAKVNVDHSQTLAQQFGVRGIPTLILFKQGKIVETKVGALSKGQLQSFIDGAL